MELSTVEIPRIGARQAAKEYATAAKTERDPQLRAEFEEIARAYRIAAADQVPLIALTPTIGAGGTVIRTLVSRDKTVRTNYLLPKLAVMKADARFAYSLGVQADGSTEFVDRLGRRDTYRKGRFTLQTGFELPPDFRAGERLGEWTSSAWSAMVPIVPPRHVPARASLASRLVLFEVEQWSWVTVPRPPGDPALLRHVGGDIYAVEAVWDLTPLEQLVLSGREAQGMVWNDRR